MRSQIVRNVALVVVVMVVVGILSLRARGAPAEPCAGPGAFVAVDTRARTLALCAGGAAGARFPVALGLGGIGKRRQGDNRTPLGAYPLGAPRASRDYGIFIPIGYPTPEQERAGFTGSAVGIHGPPRANVSDGASNTATDWTWGCIALGSDPEIAHIAAWIRAHPRVEVRID